MEGLSKAALIKSLSPRVMLSNHLLPKGTKMKVDLEDRDRQKVSFSFAPTKKPLQSPFFIPDKSTIDPNAASSQSTSDREEPNTDIKTEQNQTPMAPIIAETPSQTPVCSDTSLKTDLAKMHFKKQILSVSMTEEKPTLVVQEEPLPLPLEIQQKPTSLTEFPVPQPQNIVSVCPSEKYPIEAPETRVTPGLNKPPVSSGKDGESSSSAEQDSKVDNRKTRSRSGSESDGELMSSSRKSIESKSKINSDCRSKEVKKSSSGSHLEGKEKGSSKRSENHERSSSYSKSDRDSRHASSRSSRSDKDRRRSRSRSRSRSRGSRTSSSHSRSERSRCDRRSRSERSYYHDSDRRSHRSSPRRERRRSRSRTDRARDSSDSEDDQRKTRTRTSNSSRLSTNSSSHKESKSSSYSKSEKLSKSVDSPHSSELDKRTQQSKPERTSKRLSDSDSQRKCSPDLDPSYRKSSTRYKAETSSKSSSSSAHTHSQTHEKRQKNSPSDTEADHKGKFQVSDKGCGSEENCKNSLKKTGEPDSEETISSRLQKTDAIHDRQSNDTFHCPAEAPPCTNATESGSMCEKAKSVSQQVEPEHCNKDFKEIVSCTDRSLRELSPVRSKETKSDHEFETSALPLSESLKHANEALENVTNVKYGLSSNIQPDVNSNAAVINHCINNYSSITFTQDKKVDSLLRPKYLIDTAEIPVTLDVQQTTSPEIVKVDKPPGTSLPPVFDSPCIESEGELTLEQQNLITVKNNSRTTKKSRWDIVGQDTPESDNSLRTLCAESKPSATKVISVKKIEFSKDNIQPDVMDSIQPEDETRSILVKQEVGSDSKSMTDKHKDQSQPSQASTSIDHCDLKPGVSQKSNTGEPLHLNEKSQAGNAMKTQSWNGDHHEDRSKDGSQNKLGKRALLNQHALGEQSEVSDSDNSEYDSDCGEAIKRLHSVVVVPKNSSLTMDSHDRGAFSCGLMSSSAQRDVNTNEIPNQGTQPMQESASAFAGNSALNAGVDELSPSSMLCQSQSNMIDSTSHLESSRSVSAQPYAAALIGAHSSATDPAHSLDSSGLCQQGHQPHNVSSRGERTYSHYQHENCSNADNISDRNGLNLGWDFSQSEQPSSTYQQPDSSHGPQMATTKLTESSLKEQEHRLSNATWNHQPSNTQTSRPPYLHVHGNYQDPAGEIHPDSLTNDHDDYSGNKPSDLSKTAVEGSLPPGSSSFVQGHEISSNSRGSVVPDPPREEHFRPHRGRGPPKKRRPEIESDSDNEAEAGPAGKRERQGDADTPKASHVKAEVQRPTLSLRDFRDSSRWKDFARSKKMPPYFDLIEENMYLTER